MAQLGRLQAVCGLARQSLNAHGLFRLWTRQGGKRIVTLRGAVIIGGGVEARNRLGNQS